jgi:flavorubredoxin
MAKELAKGIYALHTNLTDSPYFEGFWSIPTGVTLNSYLVVGEKIALIDICNDSTDSLSNIENQLKEIGISMANIDYVILNHLESDHSGALSAFLDKNDKAQILSSAKGIALVKNFCKIDEEHRFKVLTDLEQLSLGNNKTLQFFETPNVHWPETIMTYEISSGTLFSCDGFGSYGKTGEKLLDTEFSEGELVDFEKEALRYYANIVASFSLFVTKAVEKLSSVTINIVAPSHGVVWTKDPMRIINLYKKFAGYNTKGTQEKKVCIICGSMYGNTKEMAREAEKLVKAQSWDCQFLPIPETDVSYVLASALEAEGLILAMPTYEYGIYPPMRYVFELFMKKHFYDKKILRIGSKGWVGGAEKEYKEICEKMRWNALPSVEWFGKPSTEDKNQLSKSVTHFLNLLENKE